MDEERVVEYAAAGRYAHFGRRLKLRLQHAEVLRQQPLERVVVARFEMAPHDGVGAAADHERAAPRRDSRAGEHA